MRKAFTLLETIAMMVVMAILAVTFMYKWSTYDAIRLEGAGRKMVADIRYTQQIAKSTQTRAGMIFFSRGYDVYSIINAPSPVFANSPGGNCSERPDGKFSVDYTNDRCKEFSGVTLSFVNNSIAFNSIGRLVNATTGADLGTQSVTVNYSGTKIVSIDGVTGRASY